MTNRQFLPGALLSISLGFCVLASSRATADPALGRQTPGKTAPDRTRQPADSADQPAAAAGPVSDTPDVAMKKLLHWHVGDPPSTDNFGGDFVLEKHYNPNKPSRPAENGPAPAVGSYEYLRLQVWRIKGGQRPGGFSKQAFAKREQAVDNLEALGPAAAPAFPALAWSAMNEQDRYVKLAAIKIIGEFGGMEGVVVVGWTLREPGNDAELTQTAEDALLKLLPTLGEGLTMNDAMYLYQLHRLDDKRLSPAIESALAASGLSAEVIAKELDRREAARQALIAQAVAKAKAQAQAEKKWNVFFAALPADWQARLTQAFAKAKASGQPEEATAKFKQHFMTLPPVWQEWYMTPTPAPPDLAYWWDKVQAGDGESDAERHAKEIDRQNRERAANRTGS